MKDTVINEKNVKIPLYVAAYETISQWLKDGKYKAGDKLPGENILAEQLQVSRGTLRQAMLLLPQKIARPACFQIVFSDRKAVRGFAHYFQPLDRLLAAAVRQQDTIRLLLSTPYTAAQLVELA